ncbi:MAG TPA: ribulose-phosphate 3-epimerase [Chloroflexota bacterium]|jgi:ribulose-phosphate 3-epimerase
MLENSSVPGVRHDPSLTHCVIAPSILTADLGHLAEQIQLAETAGADRIHLDIMDGQFVPNISFGWLIVEAVRAATSLPLDVHLMIVQPDRYVPDFARAGANHITVHQEVCPHLHRQLAQIKELGATAGVALNPATPLYTIEDVIDDLDLLLIMSVNPGFGGQSFISHALDKLRRARALFDTHGSKADLEVDGGVNESTIASVVAAGANVCVTGSAVYNRTRSVADSVSALRAALDAPYVGPA